MKSRNVLLFFAAVLALLAAICGLLPHDGIKLGGHDLNIPSLAQVLHPDDETADTAVLDPEVVALLQQHQDSLDQYHQWRDSSDYRFWMPGDDETFFDGLFAAMETAAQQGRWLRVLHYGDSQIEMDHITSRLRSRLQETFGGSGLGFVPLQTIVPTPAVTQWSSRNLPRLTPLSDSLAVRSTGNYGFMAQCFRLDGDVTTNLRLGNNKHCDPRIYQCSQVGVLYRERGSSLRSLLTVRAPYRSDAATADTQLLSTDQLVGLHLWRTDSAATRLQLSLNGSADIYGVMLDGDPGVMVDNIPLRGCSGTIFTQINSNLLADAYSLLDIGLIILEFGGNSIPYIRGEKTRNNYCKELGRQIDRMHHCCPQAKILFVGPADMSTSIGGHYQSYPHLETAIEAIRDTAMAHGAAYWSQYDAMGGHNAMLRWVQKGWAGKDYIHFSQRGADEMGDLLADALLNMYRYYRLRRNPPQVKP